jgi:hypothetical protein
MKFSKFIVSLTMLVLLLMLLPRETEAEIRQPPMADTEACRSLFREVSKEISSRTAKERFLAWAIGCKSVYDIAKEAFGDRSKRDAIRKEMIRKVRNEFSGRENFLTCWNEHILVMKSRCGRDYSCTIEEAEWVFGELPAEAKTTQPPPKPGNRPPDPKIQTLPPGPTMKQKNASGFCTCVHRVSFDGGKTWQITSTETIRSGQYCGPEKCQ